MYMNECKKKQSLLNIQKMFFFKIEVSCLDVLSVWYTQGFNYLMYFTEHSHIYLTTEESILHIS